MTIVARVAYLALSGLAAVVVLPLVLLAVLGAQAFRFWDWCELHGEHDGDTAKMAKARWKRGY